MIMRQVELEEMVMFLLFEVISSIALSFLFLTFPSYMKLIHLQDVCHLASPLVPPPNPPLNPLLPLIDFPLKASRLTTPGLQVPSPHRCSENESQ